MIENRIHYIELMEESWVKFSRAHCAGDTWIDFWEGDMADNPNNNTKSPVQLNSHRFYFRMPGEKWQFLRSSYRLLMDCKKYGELFTAWEILESYQDAELKRIFDEVDPQ